MCVGSVRSRHGSCISILRRGRRLGRGGMEAGLEHRFGGCRLASLMGDVGGGSKARADSVCAMRTWWNGAKYGLLGVS